MLNAKTIIAVFILLSVAPFALAHAYGFLIGVENVRRWVYELFSAPSAGRDTLMIFYYAILAVVACVVAACRMIKA